MSVARNLHNTLYYFKKPNRWQNGVGAELPEAYKKFWHEWKLQQPAAVHYIPEPGKYKFNPKSNQVDLVQNVPIPLIYPKEIDEGIWGGEAVVQGFQQKKKYRRRVAKFWVPHLFRSVVYSEVLNAHMRTVITIRTLDLIHENYGFDHYLLKTPACDLRSVLALRIKRNILLALADKTLYPEDPVKREKVYEQYKQYLAAYTREEIEWYGLTYLEAVYKHVALKRAKQQIIPLKQNYRSELISKLKESNIAEASLTPSEETSWVSKLNPFSKSP